MKEFVERWGVKLMMRCITINRWRGSRRRCVAVSVSRLNEKREMGMQRMVITYTLPAGLYLATT